jgi:DnaJ-class molecular chaperone
MRQIRTHYDNLKVSRDAPIEVIQAAYRSLARKHHPDRSGGSSESEGIMKVINASYEVLSDPEARAKYDRWLATEAADHPGSDKPESGSRHRRISGGELLVGVGYVLAALTLLRLPGPVRLIGIGMLVAGFAYLIRRAR